MVAIPIAMLAETDNLDHALNGASTVAPINGRRGSGGQNTDS